MTVFKVLHFLFDFLIGLFIAKLIVGALEPCYYCGSRWHASYNCPKRNL